VLDFCFKSIPSNSTNLIVNSSNHIRIQQLQSSLTPKNHQSKIIQNIQHFYSNQNKIHSTLSKCIAFEHFIAFQLKISSSLKPYQTIKMSRTRIEKKDKENLDSP
jgi:hypothetical protein